MNNKMFQTTSIDERRSKLARTLKTKSSLSDEDIIKCVNRININNQYSIKSVNKNDFPKKSKKTEHTIKKTSDWTIKQKVDINVLINNECGGIAVKEEILVGSLNLQENEKKCIILVY